MATYSEIRINYNNSKNKAAKLEDLADQLRAIAKNDLGKSLDMLSNEWKGESAKAFRDKGEALKEELLETAKLMERSAKSIRTVAKKIYDTERAAIDLIESRKRSAGSTFGGGGFGGGSGGGRSW